MAYDDAPKPKERKVTVPEGFADEPEFIQYVRTTFQQDVDFDQTNRDEGLLDLKFLAGEQWDPDALTARKGKPCLTINDLPAKVAQVVGDMRINRPSIRVRPAEDADKDLAEVREGMIRAIERDSDAQGVYIATGESQVACGIGNFRVMLKNADDAGFERDIRIEGVPDPFAVVWDAFSTERTGKDAEHCFVVDEVPRKLFERRWKDELPSDLEVPSNDANGWFAKDAVKVVEYWSMKDAKVTYARLESGATVEVEGEPGKYQQVRRGGKGKKLVPLQAPVALDDDGAEMVRPGTRRYACMYLVTGHAILSGPHELPIPRVPIFRARGWEVNVRERRVRFGLVRWARDPARLKNYWRSVSAEMLALAGKGKWLVHEQNEGDADGFRDAHASDDPVLFWSGQVAPQYVGPPMLNSAVLQEAALSAQDMKDVTGLHDASLGAKSNETSGKAILARQREGDVGTFIYHDNLQAAIEEAGRVANALIPVTYDTARTIRIVGEDDSTKVQRINDKATNSVDVNQGRYDIVVETGPSYSTKRVEAAESMAQFFQVVPAAAQAAGDLFAKAQDWPMADEIAERLKKTLPPQLTEGEDELTPEQEAAKAEAMKAAKAQQETQQAGIRLEMADKAAGVELKRSQAAKIKAEAEAMQAPQGPQESPLDFQMKQQQLRKATADADKAEWDAESAHVKLQVEIANLANKPLEVAHSEADLNAKLNPTPPQGVE